MHYLRVRFVWVCQNSKWAHKISGISTFAMTFHSRIVRPPHSQCFGVFMPVSILLNCPELLSGGLPFLLLRIFIFENRPKKNWGRTIREHPVLFEVGWRLVIHLSGVRIFSVRLLYQTHTEFCWTECELNSLILLNWALECHYLFIYIYVNPGNRTTVIVSSQCCWNSIIIIYDHYSLFSFYLWL